MHLVQGIAATSTRGVEQATRSVCGPLLGLAFVSSTDGHNRRWAEDCIQFNDSVLEYLSASPTINVVVLATAANQYLSENTVLRRTQRDPILHEPHFTEAAGSVDVAIASLQQTVTQLRSMGKRVVLVTSMPISDFDVGRCHELRATERPVFGADRPSCAIDEWRFRAFRKEVLSLVDKLETLSDVPVIDFALYVCRHGECATEIGGTPLYLDKAHLSREGSILLAKNMLLGDRIWQLAR